MIQTLLPVAATVALLATGLPQEPAPPVSVPKPAQAGDPPMPACTADEVTLESGLRYCVLAKGEGSVSPSMGDLVKVDYTGWLLNGTSFDSSRKPRRPGLQAEPAEFAVGGVIDGWNEALQLMVPGDHWRLHIPAAMAYGKDGSPPKIGPNEDLVFEVQLHEIVQTVPRFVAWDAEAEGIQTLENGLAYRVLEAGTGASIEEAGQGMVGFSVHSTAGAFALAHTVLRANDGVSLQPGRVPLPFMGDVLKELRVGSRVQVRVPNALGFSAQSPVDAIPAGEDELWIMEGLAVRPSFRMPTPEELTTTESGLQYQLLTDGEGAPPTKADRVSVDYVGWFTDGESFDASFDRGQPAMFGVGQVIPGWTEGLQLMKPGSEAIFVIPAALGYGSSPPPGFRKDADLVFYVKLREVLGR